MSGYIPEPAREYNSQREFQEDAERRAERFNAHYGVRGAWTDDQLRNALAEHGMPAFESIPDEPRGMYANNPAIKYPTSAAGRHRWRRTNAAHLLGHVMLHEGMRCGGCADWDIAEDERLLAGLLGTVDQPETIDIVEHGSHGIAIYRCYEILDRWSDWGFWEYGTSLRAGWWTPQGVAWMRSLGIRP